MTRLKVSTDVDHEIHMTRTFDAPRRLVVQAMTTPALIQRWLGGVRATALSVDVDFRVGGTSRYVLRPRQGAEFAFGGIYRELSDDRIVQTDLAARHSYELEHALPELDDQLSRGRSA